MNLMYVVESEVRVDVASLNVHHTNVEAGPVLEGKCAMLGSF